MKEVTSIADLASRGRSDPAFERLAVLAAKNLGGEVHDLDAAIRWLELNAQEAADACMEEGLDPEEAIVDEINGCIPLL